MICNGTGRIPLSDHKISMLECRTCIFWAQNSWRPILIDHYCNFWKKKFSVQYCHFWKKNFDCLNAEFPFSERQTFAFSECRFQVWNKRSKDLGALLDSCSWDDIANFLQTCIKNSLLQTKSIEIWVNSHTVPLYACINFRSYSTP